MKSNHVLAFLVGVSTCVLFIWFWASNIQFIDALVTLLITIMLASIIATIAIRLFLSDKIKLEKIRSDKDPAPSDAKEFLALLLDWISGNWSRIMVLLAIVFAISVFSRLTELSQLMIASVNADRIRNQNELLRAQTDLLLQTAIADYNERIFELNAALRPFDLLERDWVDLGVESYSGGTPDYVGDYLCENFAADYDCDSREFGVRPVAENEDEDRRYHLAFQFAAAERQTFADRMLTRMVDDSARTSHLFADGGVIGYYFFSGLEDICGVPESIADMALPAFIEIVVLEETIIESIQENYEDDLLRVTYAPHINRIDRVLVDVTREALPLIVPSSTDWMTVNDRYVFLHNVLHDIYRFCGERRDGIEENLQFLLEQRDLNTGDPASARPINLPGIDNPIIPATLHP